MKAVSMIDKEVSIHVNKSLESYKFLIENLSLFAKLIELIAVVTGNLVNNCSKALYNSGKYMTESYGKQDPSEHLMMLKKLL